MGPFSLTFTSSIFLAYLVTLLHRRSVYQTRITYYIYVCTLLVLGLTFYIIISDFTNPERSIFADPILYMSLLLLVLWFPKMISVMAVLARGNSLMESIERTLISHRVLSTVGRKSTEATGDDQGTQASLKCWCHDNVFVQEASHLQEVQELLDSAITVLESTQRLQPLKVIGFTASTDLVLNTCYGLVFLVAYLANMILGIDVGLF